MANWTEQYPLIRQRAEEALTSQGMSMSTASLADLLGVSRGKVQAWGKGQRPSADDLETMASVLGFSPSWLLTGKGEPEAQLEDTERRGRQFSATNQKGLLIGDMLWDIFGVLNLDLPTVSQKSGIPLKRLQTIMASEVKPSFSDLTKLHGKLHLDVHYLLTGEGEHLCPHDEYTRIARATGTELWDDHGLARVFGCSVAELLEWKKKRGTTREDMFPLAWLDTALELYGINPAWARRGIGKSHLSRDEVRQQLGGAGGYSVREAANSLRAAEQPGEYPAPKKAAGDDTV